VLSTRKTIPKALVFRANANPSRAIEFPASQHRMGLPGASYLSGFNDET
jgi:hypothetical protein